MVGGEGWAWSQTRRHPGLTQWVSASAAHVVLCVRAPQASVGARLSDDESALAVHAPLLRCVTVPRGRENMHASIARAPDFNVPLVRALSSLPPPSQNRQYPH